MADAETADLLDLLLDKLASSTSLDDRTKDVVLAAALGEEHLAAAIGGTAPPRPGRSGATVAPRRTYLSSISVTGFRGIAGETRLGLSPGPGLTLVVGRNGSGKSSFAEACELALTGTSLRWQGRTKVWQEGWRNLHHSADRSVEVRLVVDGRPGTTTVKRAWLAHENLDAGKVAGAEDGMAEAVATFRPFLSYNELGGLLEDGPSRLYDAISQVLGLELFVAAEERLTRARKAVEDRAKAVKSRATQLAALLDGVDDGRAEACAAALRRRGGPDVAAVEGLLTTAGATGGEADSESAVLEQLARLSFPSGDLDAVALDLLAAVDAVEAATGTESGRAREVADLLQRALEVHGRTSEPACPVCGTRGVLDEDWRSRTRVEIDRLRAAATAAEQAASHLRSTQDAARRMISEPPAVLSATVGAVGLAPARDAWTAWAAAPGDDPRALAEHLVAKGPPARAAVEEVRAAARAELKRREDAWRPLEQQLLAWLPGANAAADEAPLLESVRAALAWLRETSDAQRNERFEPIARQVKATWELLRQQSSVSISDLALKGTGTRRSLDLSVTVDDTEGAALAVMSQGELHAMALSLFLPRATLPHSPFGFLVIDDPVQSMDAARVDGLARALAEAAATHQVVVFTHDERLPQAARLLRLPATVLEVTRGTRSEVTVRRRATPAGNYLDDASAVLKTEEFPPEARRRVVPGLCRSALEAACLDVARRRRLAAGDRHEDVERLVSSVTKVLPRLALALFDDDTRAGDVLADVNRRWGRDAGDTVQALKTGAHKLVDDHPAVLIEQTERLVAGLEALA